jgi:hypothetical protein
MKARHQQIIATLTVALALSAVLIGSAQAADRPDNRAGIRGIGSQNAEVSDVFTRAVARAHAIQAVRPDDRAGLRGASTSPTTPIALSDVFERAVLRHNASTAPRPDDRASLGGAGTALADNAPVATAASGGFQWADAEFGAAATLALILVLVGLAVALANHRRSNAILD